MKQFTGICTIRVFPKPLHSIGNIIFDMGVTIDSYNFKSTLYHEAFEIHFYLYITNSSNVVLEKDFKTISYIIFLV